MQRLRAVRKSIRHTVRVLVVIALAVDFVVVNAICYQVIVAGVWEPHYLVRLLPAFGYSDIISPFARACWGNPQPWWQDLEWRQRSEALVSGRPDLTGSLTDAQIASRTNNIARYFESAGVARERVRDMQFAYSPEASTLITFKLSASDIEQFLRGKTPLNESVSSLLAELDSSGSITTERFIEGASYMTSANFRLRRYPFVRLDWWPIDGASIERMRAYEAATTWDFGERRVGMSYFVFIEDSGRGYLLGP